MRSPERVADDEIKQPSICGMRTGYVALAALTIQMSALTFAARLSRTGGGDPYIVSVAVFVTELLKLFICLSAATLSFRISHGRLPSRAQCLSGFRVAVSTASPLLLPASLFTLQAGLNLYAATGLDAVTFQVTNQMKILPTAGFSTLYLQRKLSTRQMISLPLLAIGVTFVHLSNKGVETGEVGRHNREWWLGLIAAVSAAVFSGFASVRVEQLLKERIWHPHYHAHADSESADPAPHSPLTTGGGTGPSRRATAASAPESDDDDDDVEPATVSAVSAGPPRPPPGVGDDGLRSLVLVNVQLSFLGIFFASLQAVLVDGAALAQDGIFHGFNVWAVCNILLQAVGGLLVAYVVKYTDNIVKGFATAVSIVMSLLLSCLFYGHLPALSFMVGVVLVIAAFLLYAGAVTLPWAVTACLENPDPHGALLSGAKEALNWLLGRDGDKSGGRGGSGGLLGGVIGYYGVARVSILIVLLFAGSLVVRGGDQAGSSITTAKSAGASVGGLVVAMQPPPPPPVPPWPPQPASASLAGEATGSVTAADPLALASVAGRMRRPPREGPTGGSLTGGVGTARVRDGFESMSAARADRGIGTRGGEGQPAQPGRRGGEAAERATGLPLVGAVASSAVGGGNRIGSPLGETSETGGGRPVQATSKASAAAEGGTGIPLDAAAAAAAAGVLEEAGVGSGERWGRGGRQERRPEPSRVQAPLPPPEPPALAEGAPPRVRPPRLERGYAGRLLPPAGIKARGGADVAAAVRAASREVLLPRTADGVQGAAVAAAGGAAVGGRAAGAGDAAAATEQQLLARITAFTGGDQPAEHETVGDGAKNDTSSGALSKPAAAAAGAAAVEAQPSPSVNLTGPVAGLAPTDADAATEQPHSTGVVLRSEALAGALKRAGAAGSESLLLSPVGARLRGAAAAAAKGEVVPAWRAAAASGEAATAIAAAAAAAAASAAAGAGAGGAGAAAGGADQGLGGFPASPASPELAHPITGASASASGTPAAAVGGEGIDQTGPADADAGADAEAEAAAVEPQKRKGRSDTPPASRLASSHPTDAEAAAAAVVSPPAAVTGRGAVAATANRPMRMPSPREAGAKQAVERSSTPPVLQGLALVEVKGLSDEPKREHDAPVVRAAAFTTPDVVGAASVAAAAGAVHAKAHQNDAAAVVGGSEIEKKLSGGVGRATTAAAEAAAAAAAAAVVGAKPPQQPMMLLE